MQRRPWRPSWNESRCSPNPHPPVRSPRF
jgi:hypothetical protein